MHRVCRIASKSVLLGTVFVSLQGAAAFAQVAPGESSVVDEIIVTVNKRPQAVRAIAGSVSALTGEQLDIIGAQSMADYIGRTPGVVLNGGTPGNQTVTVRGVSTGLDQGQGTTGYFINEAPLTDPGFSIGTPDIDTFDVENVAVLRGPQGTLFGSGSLGGAVNYQAAKPDLGGFGARVQGGVETTDHGGVGDAIRMMINIPLKTETLAVRGVFYNREVAGSIDNLGTGQDDADKTRIQGGRLQALWKPATGTTISYLFLRQTTKTRDNGTQQPVALGELRKSTLVSEPSRFNTLLHNVRLDQQLSFGTLTAMATYHRKAQDSLSDATADLSSSLLDLAPVTIGQTAKSKGTTFEVRLASAEGGRLDYVVGAMYDETDEKIRNYVGAGGAEALTDALFGSGSGAVLAPGDVILDAHLPVKSKEAALFGELTYRFSDQWKATVGGRLFSQKITNRTTAQGLFVLLTSDASNVDFTGPSQKEDGFNPKLSLTWTPNDDLMVYGLVSKGFRSGGPNVIPSTPGAPVPAAYESDSLINYEIGARADLLDKRLLLDVTGFYIDWSNIQLRQQTPASLNFGINAGAAEIWGVETSASLRLADGLRLSTAITWLDATLVDGYGSLPAGSTLPGASDWLVSNVLTYDLPVQRFSPTLVLTHRFVSKAPGALGTDSVQGDYNLFDGRFRFNLGAVGVSAYVENIGDQRGVTGGSADAQTIVRPRTFGLTLDFRM